MSGEPDPYEILQVRPDAGEDIIRAAYRALARRYHPDASINGVSAPEMVVVNWAWEILGNPQRRSVYDREHGILPRPVIAAQEAHPPATWSAPGGANGAGGGADGPGGAAGSAGTAGASGTTGATGTTGTTPGTRPGNPGSGTGTGSPGSQASGSRPASGTGRPPIQRRGADGQIIEWRSAPDGTGAAGEPPGPPSGTILPFGRYIAWSIGEVVRYDPGYLDWLDQRREGALYHDEIDAVLKRHGWRQGPASRERTSRWGR